MLDAVNILTPKRLVTWHNDIPPLTPKVRKRIEALGISLPEPSEIITASMIDNDTIQVGESTLKKPFVEKPVSGEDHNVFIYYSQSQGGGVRRLFRKVHNKSSDFVPNDTLTPIRCDGSSSYIYEEFMCVDNAEDVKVYTIGPSFAHAETRKSPVVDGIVRRTPDGKEIRYVTKLTPTERIIASKLCQVFGQTICGFDLLRADGCSYVIDVNGWSFVKGNSEYYDASARSIANLFRSEIGRGPGIVKQASVETQWKMKAFLSVMRHADRTPKQKLKFNFKSEPFLDLVRGSEEEIVMKRPEQVKCVIEAVKKAQLEGIEDPVILEQLLQIIDDKGDVTGTKVQLRPSFNKEDKTLQKVQIIVKWGIPFIIQAAC